MSSSLKKPKQRVYRNFLYLDGDAVVNSLSSLEGGDIDEVLTKQLDENGGDLGGEVGVSGAKVKGGRKKGKRYEEEIRKKRTEHSAASMLLTKLHDADAIGVLEGAYGAEEHDDLDEHMMLELQAEIVIHPLHQMVAAARAWIKAAPGFGATKADMADMKETVSVLEALSRSGENEERTFLVFANPAERAPGYRLVLPIKEQKLLVPLDEFAGRATIVAQVDRILASDERLLAMRLLRSAPQLDIERTALVEALPDLLEGMREMGITASGADFVLEAPSVLLRPICIYR